MTPESTNPNLEISREISALRKGVFIALAVVLVAAALVIENRHDPRAQVISLIVCAVILFGMAKTRDAINWVRSTSRAIDDEAARQKLS